MIKALATYLAENLTGLTIGTNLFAGPIPMNAQAECSALLERTGAYRDPYDETEHEIPIQIITRSTDYQTGRDEAHRIASFLLTNQWSVTISGPDYGDSWLVYSISGYLPADIGRDDKLRHLFSANVVVRAAKQ